VTPEPMTSKARWLVVGHGSVGSFIAERLATTGSSVAVLDPEPRLPIVAGTAVTAIEEGAYDCVVSCVPPDMAEAVPATIKVGLGVDGLFFDWNTVSPEVKRRIAAAVPAGTVDVALLDSVDGGNGRRPRLAVSGAGSGRGAELLAEAGFDVVDAGPDVGQAATLKYLRSVFMKTLEALVLEFSALAAELDPDEIVRNSLTNNLGAEFSSFMDLLVSTNRFHAARRANELADAVASFADEGTRPDLAAAAVDVLFQAAKAWEKGAPPEGATPDELSHHLRSALWGQAGST
jgi:3-hydroxyisobutyrate dehydrogenase-like beta-hydroxyacid dehydrogenase